MELKDLRFFADKTTNSCKQWQQEILHAGPARVTKLHCNVFKNGGGIRNFREKTGDE